MRIAGPNCWELIPGSAAYHLEEKILVGHNSMADGASSHREDGWCYALASPYAVARASKFSIRPLKLDETLYKCSFCARTFISPQARGGHQNAHKKEIAELRRSLKEDMEIQRAKRARSDVIASHEVSSLLEVDSSDAVTSPDLKMKP